MNNGQRRTATGKRINKKTIVFYECVLKLLQEYECQKETSVQFRLLPRQSFRVNPIEKKYWLKFYHLFSAFLYSKGYSDGYVGSIWKSIKTLVRWIIKEKALAIAPVYNWFTIIQTANNPVILSVPKFQFLIKDELYSIGLTANLNRIKDIFLAGCTLGIRFSDLMRLQKKNLIIVEGQPYIILYTIKTGSYIKIPVPDYLSKIFKNYRKSNGKFLLPQYSNSRFNILIKRLGEKIGWTEILPKYMSYKGKWIEQKKEGNQSWKYYDHLSSHTMRRTAITTLLVLGVPEQVVRRVSGHAPGSKEFYKYVVIAQEILNTEVQEAHKKLLQQDNYSKNDTKNT
mgnify:CR=1 FL=1